jgi:beta-glucosidase
MTSMAQTTTVDHEVELAGRLAQLSLEQKVQLMTGADIWSLHPMPDIGLRRLITSDGPAGVRGETWDERSPSANVPSPTALAASWDPVRVERMGRLLASEARRKGVDVLLAPTVNLHRTPYGGRHFECFSEDSELTAMIGTAYVTGLQAEGVAATVKHFVANDSETDRFSVNALVDERVLRELYLTPFERIVAAGAWSAMAAYNQVNGTTMTENRLQREVLKREWGFDGVIMSDWYATRSVAAAGEDLLDLAMPGPESPWTEWLLEAVQSGKISESAVDGHVLRILRLAARVGALEGLQPVTLPASSTSWSTVVVWAMEVIVSVLLAPLR